MQKKDGMMYAPVGKAERVCEPGEFPIAAVGLDHGHIYGMCNGLTEAGADVKWVFNQDRSKMQALGERFGARQGLLHGLRLRESLRAFQ